MPLKKRAMDVLDDLCGEISDESSTDDEKGQPPVKRTAAAASCSKLSVEALERAGYTSGPSVLHVPEQRSKEPESTWEWSKGHEQQDQDASPTERVCTEHLSLVVWDRMDCLAPSPPIHYVPCNAV
jgi:hypothetical protein